MEANRAELRERLWPFFKNPRELDEAVEMMVIKLSTGPNRFAAKRAPRPEAVTTKPHTPLQYHEAMMAEGSLRLGQAMERYVQAYGMPPRGPRQTNRIVRMVASPRPRPCMRCGAARECAC